MLAHTIIFCNDILAAAISIISNLSLLYLIQKKTTDELKPYSKILRLNCFVDLFCTITVCLTFFSIDIDHGEYILLLTGPFKDVPHPINGFLVLLFAFALYFCTSVICIPFFYRYFLIVRGKTLSNKKIYFMYVLIGLSSFGVCVFLYFAVWPSIDPIKRQEFLHVFQEDDLWLNDNGDYPIFLASHFSNFNLYLIIIYGFFVLTIVYGLVFWSGLKTWKHLKQFKYTMSERSRQLQTQLTYTLVAQVSAPIAVAFLPIVLIFTMVFFKLPIYRLGTVLGSLVSWASVFNPLCSIFLVGPYRDAILRKNRVNSFATVQSSNVYL